MLQKRKYASGHKAHKKCSSSIVTRKMRIQYSDTMAYPLEWLLLKELTMPYVK